MFLTKLKGVTTILLLLSLPLFGIGLWTTHLAVGQQATPPLQANANPVKPKADTERLQGTWEVIETRSDGETRPVPESLDGRLVIEGDEFRLMFWSKPTKLEGNTRSGNVLLATYKLNTTKSPRNIDLITSKDPAAHKLCLGIYKLDGDDLMICLPREKPERRPAEFTADKGSGQQLYKLKRAKAETGAPKKDTPKGETAKEAEQQKVKETTAKLEEAEQQKEKEAAKLKGTWKTVAVEIAGQALPEDTAKANVWEIAVYGKLKTKLPNNKEGTELEVRPFTIDPTKKPAHIDIEGEVGGNKTVTEGIYKLDGDELAVCLIGVKGGRPSEFFSCQFDKGDEKGGNILMKFKRVQEDKAKEDKEKDDKRVQENKVKEDKEKTDKRVQENKVKEDKEKEDKELAPQKDEPKKGDKQRASIAPVKSPGSSLATTIKIGDISYTLPFAFPSGEEILRALPAKVRPKNGRIEGELLEYRLDAPKDYPLVGRGRLAQARFKCTVFTDSGNEIVYIDRDHLVVEK